MPPKKQRNIPYPEILETRVVTPINPSCPLPIVLKNGQTPDVVFELPTCNNWALLTRRIRLFVSLQVQDIDGKLPDPERIFSTANFITLINTLEVIKNGKTVTEMDNFGLLSYLDLLCQNDIPTATAFDVCGFYGDQFPYDSAQIGGQSSRLHQLAAGKVWHMAADLQIPLLHNLKYVPAQGQMAIRLRLNPTKQMLWIDEMDTGTPELQLVVKNIYLECGYQVFKNTVSAQISRPLQCFVERQLLSTVTTGAGEKLVSSPQFLLPTPPFAVQMFIMKPIQDKKNPLKFPNVADIDVFGFELSGERRELVVRNSETGSLHVVLAARDWFYSGRSSNFSSRFVRYRMEGPMNIGFFDLRRKTKTYPLDVDKIDTLDKPLESNGAISFSFYSKHRSPVKTPIILFAVLHYYGRTVIGGHTLDLTAALQ